MKFHPIADIFPMMNESEFQELKDDIQKNGLIEPIWTYQDKIVDGRNRFNACKELGVKPKFKKWTRVNGTALVDFVISLNLKRRHLTASQKAMSAVDALPFFEKEAKKRKISTLKKGKKFSDRALVPHRENGNGRSREMVAKLFNVSGRYVQYGKAIQETMPYVADQIRNGNLTITQGKIKLKRQERVDALKKAGKQFKSNHHLKIVHSGFVKWCNDNLEDNSIDLILTDPPYAREYLGVYSQLGEIANRVLKPSKWLITYCNIKFIPEVSHRLSKHLTYWWMVSLHYKGAVRLKFSTFNAWKPILIYHKEPPRLPKLLCDHITVSSREKDMHDWQQSEEPFKYIIERFSKTGDLVLDPMAGAGTVLKVSKDLKRKCIAIDRNKECVEIMRGRLKI